MRLLAFLAVCCASAQVLAADWKQEPAIALAKSAFSRGTIGPAKPSKYISYDLPFEPFAGARAEVERRGKLTLENRGEAHITIVTPPEFEQLVKVMAPGEIRRVIGDQLAGDSTKVKAICVGQGAKGSLQTWFVVVEMPTALKARGELERTFQARLKAKAPQGETPRFNAAEFNPHVTLGFIGRDLHLQDGVLKNETSCKYPIE